jgi:arginase family enzyme
LEVSARVIVEAPSHLGLRAPGVEGLPEALLAAGFAERIGARRGTRLAPPAFDPTIDAGTGLLNPHGLRDYAPKLADAVGVVLDEGAFPIVLGGDCTILLGITLALRAGFWVHLDVDVLDDAIMPAVDYHLPDGLTWEELTVVLRTAVASDHATGLDITIFNPTLDPDGRVARTLVDALVAGLTP